MSSSSNDEKTLDIFKDLRRFINGLRQGNDEGKFSDVKMLQIWDSLRGLYYDLGTILGDNKSVAKPTLTERSSTITKEDLSQMINCLSDFITLLEAFVLERLRSNVLEDLKTAEYLKESLIQAIQLDPPTETAFSDLRKLIDQIMSEWNDKFITKDRMMQTFNGLRIIKWNLTSILADYSVTEAPMPKSLDGRITSMTISKDHLTPFSETTRVLTNRHLLGFNAGC